MTKIPPVSRSSTRAVPVRLYLDIECQRAVRPAEADADIDALMQSATTANEAESEGISYELYQQFTENPAAFLDAFSAQSECGDRPWRSLSRGKMPTTRKICRNTRPTPISYPKVRNRRLIYCCNSDRKPVEIADDTAGADRIYLQQNA